jgi:hypothetical protein
VVHYTAPHEDPSFAFDLDDLSVDLARLPHCDRAESVLCLQRHVGRLLGNIGRAATISDPHEVSAISVPVICPTLHLVKTVQLEVTTTMLQAGTGLMSGSPFEAGTSNSTYKLRAGAYFWKAACEEGRNMGRSLHRLARYRFAL